MMQPRLGDRGNRTETRVAFDGAGEMPERSTVLARGAVVLYLALAVAFFFPAFLPDRQLAGTDYFAGGYWFLDFAARRMASGNLPKWVPYIFGGLPMYSNPGSLFYPTRLIATMLLPAARVMAAVYVVQFTLAGIGMHVFARSLGARQWIAMVAAVAFELSGLAMSYVFAGQDGRIIVATLTPLTFYFVARGVDTGKLRWSLGLAAAIALALLSAQIQSAYYLLIGAALWAGFLLIGQRKAFDARRIASRIALGLGAVALAFAVAAVNLLPFSQYVSDSPRATTAGRGYAFATEFSMPPIETIGLAVPEQAGILQAYRGANAFKLHTEYVGAFVLVMLVIGVVIAARDRVWQFMLGLSLFALSISYGSHTPIYELYYRLLPGTSKFRSPSIALFLVSFALVTMAAVTLERVLRLVQAESSPGGAMSDEQRQLLRRLAKMVSGIVVLSSVVAIVAGGTALDGSARAFGWARFAVGCALIAVVLQALLRKRISVRAAAIAMVIVTAADLFVVDHHFLRTDRPPEQLFAEDDVVRFLKTHTPGRVWVFPLPDDPSAPHYAANGRFGPRSDYLMQFNVPQAGGEHGNQLYRWNQFVGVSTSGNVDWHNFVEYPAFLAAGGIRYILSGVRLQLYDAATRKGIPGLVEVFHGSSFVYLNTRTMARAELVPAVQVVSPGGALALMRSDGWDPHDVAFIEASSAPFASPPRARAAIDSATGAHPGSPGTTQIDFDDPDRVDVSVNATAPAMLVLADNDANGWRATIDGHDTPIVRTNHTLRGVAVTPGTHKVVFRFEPARFYLGLYISLGALALLCGGLVFALRDARD